MKAIDFVVRASAGGLQRGTVSAETQNQLIVAGAGQEISINARQTDFVSQVRSGDQLIMTMEDGRTITIDNFFNDSGAANRLFLSTDGYLNEVSFAQMNEGTLSAQYGPTQEWGKWSPSDELIFLDHNVVADVPLAHGEDEVSMLGSALLGGSGLLGGGAALAAGLGGAAMIAGGGGDKGPAQPYVDDADSSVPVGGDDKDKALTVTGGGEPGDEVTVTVGDKQVDTVIDEDGKFDAVFEGDNFPDDGNYESDVEVTNEDGDKIDLDGPSFDIDTTAPELTVTEGTESTGDFFNEVSFAEGVTISGTGEANSTIDVTIAGITQSTVVDGEGAWTVGWAVGTLEAGEYTSDVTLVTSDSFGNTRTYTETLVVDTVTSVTLDETTFGGDGVINGAELVAGVSFSGTAQAGSTVEVTAGSVTHTVTATAEGTWTASFTSTEIATGEYQGSVAILATDVHGNTATTSGTFDVDTLVRDFSITSSTGGADGVINAEESGQDMTVTGMTEPGSTVVVELGGVSETATVSASGSWSATFAAGTITSGTYTTIITATATDAAGNVDVATSDVAVDTEAGVLTISPDPVETDDIINKVEAQDGVVLNGTADADAIVTVTLAGVSHDVVTGADGNWEAFFSAAEVAPGVYTADITAQTTDAYGNSRSVSDSVEVDTRVDNLSVSSVTEDNIINATERADGFSVTGSTEIGSTSVEVTLGSQTVFATVAADGSWSADFDHSAIDAGTYNTGITVTATDGAGNVKTVTSDVNVDTQVDPLTMTGNSAGEDQIVNAAEAGAGIDLAGQVEAGSSVTVTFDGMSYGADVDAAGNWSVTIPATDVRAGTYGAEISVAATDHVGNTAVIEDTLSIDTDAPEGPVIASFTRGGDGIRGISIETVMVDGAPTDDTTSIVQIATDGSTSEVAGVDGYNTLREETDFFFESNVPNGSQLIVNSTDEAGNTSGTYLVLDDEALTSAVDLSNPALGEYQIENLDLEFAEAANVVIDEASLLALSTETNTLTVRGSVDDRVTIQDGVLTGTQDVDGQTYDVYSVGAEGTLLVDQDIPVTI